MTCESKIFDKKLMIYLIVPASLLLLYSWVTNVHISEEFQPSSNIELNSSESREQMIRRASFQYKFAKTREELEFSIKDNDLRFISVMGVGEYIPGEHNIPKHYIEKFGTKTIPFTCDVIETEQHAQFQTIATDKPSQRIMQRNIMHY